MKKSIWLIIAIVLILAVLPLGSQAAPLKKITWRAEYFDNASLSGSPKMVTFVHDLNLDFGLRSPGPEIPADRFSARYSDVQHLEEGTYLFLLTVDDGARVWLDGNLIIDAWDLGRKEDIKAKVYVDTTGDHTVQVAYFENTGYAQIGLTWYKLGDKEKIVGAWQGEYFNNSSLTGEPAMVRQDSGISFDWNSGSPAAKITRDNFSVRWTKSMFLDRDALYTFNIQHDDGMRVYVDGKIIYESWYDQSVVYKVRRIPIAAGYRTFVVEFYDHIGNATAYMSMKGDPGAYDDASPEPGGIGVVVDNTSPYFTWGGPASHRFVHRNGYDNHFYWTYNVDQSGVNYGRWSAAPLTEAGNYEIYVYIPGDRASTGNARYLIQHYGKSEVRAINQSKYNKEFVSLGMYYFGADGNEGVILKDSTGEAPGSTQLAFDAVKFVKR